MENWHRSSSDSESRRNARRPARTSSTAPAPQYRDRAADVSVEMNAYLQRQQGQNSGGAASVRRTVNVPSEPIPRQSRQPMQPIHVPVLTVDPDGGDEDYYHPLSPAPQHRGGAPPENRGSAPPPPPPSSHRIIHMTPAGPPSVYWSDDGASQTAGDTATIATVATSTHHATAYTFYRESTPPPGESDSDDDSHDETAEKLPVRAARPARHSRLRQSDVETGAVTTSAGSGGRRSQARAMSIGVALTTTPRASRRFTGGTTMGDGGGGGGGGSGGQDNNDYSDDADHNARRDRHFEGRATAEFAFVNGRYVPPGLRDGQVPARKPLEGSGGSGGRRSGRASRSHARGFCSGRRFWIISAVAVFSLIAIAVGIGIGVEASRSKTSSHESLAEAMPSARASLSAATASALSASTVSTASAASAVSAASPSASPTATEAVPS